MNTFDLQEILYHGRVLNEQKKINAQKRGRVRHSKRPKNNKLIFIPKNQTNIYD